nr:UBN2 domain-containing protein [Tanacetum cinerariifolium]
MVLLCLCIFEYAITIGCWNVNVVVNSHLSEGTRHHACSHVVFDATLSIPAAACVSQTVFVLAVILALCHCGFYLCRTIAFAVMAVIQGKTIAFTAMAVTHEKSGRVKLDDHAILEGHQLIVFATMTGVVIVHIIVYGNYKPTIRNKDGKDEIIPYDKFEESHKKMMSKNDEAKMVLYNALPKKEYESIFMCNTAKDVWNLLINTHQDELISNLKVYEVVLEKDLDISKVKKEKYKSLALKARKVSSDEEISCSGSDFKEYAMAVRDFKKFFKRIGKFVRQPHDDKKNFQKIKEDKKEKKDRSDSEDDSKKEEICLMELDNNEARLKVKLEPDEWIKDSGCSRHMTGNKDLFSSYKAIDR